MADKSFGVKELNLISASGTPTITSPNSVNINATNVAISTDITVGGMVSLGAGTSISSPGTNTLTFGTNSTEKVRIESDGQVVINRSSGAILADSSSKLEVYNSTENYIFVSNSTAATGQDAGIMFGPANNVYGGKIIVTSDEDFSSTANRTAHMAFYTRQDGTASEKLRIDSAGNMGLGTNNPNDQTSSGYRSFTVNDSSGGIIDLRRGDIALSGGRLVGLQHEFGLEARSTNSSSQISFYVNNAYTGRWTTDGLCFGSDTAAANALDDYEEGTFTPTLITNGGSGSVGSYGNRAGSYIKIGRQVTCFGRLQISNKGTLSGGIAIGDLPFTIADTVSTTGIDGGGVLNYFSGINSSHYTDFISANPIQATTYFVIYRGNQVGAMAGMDQGHIDNNFDCRFTVTYFTAS